MFKLVIKENSLTYITNVSKNKKKMTLLLQSFHYDGARIYTFMTNFIEDSLSVSISSERVWIDKLDYFHEIYFPKNGCHRDRKKSIFQLS